MAYLDTTTLTCPICGLQGQLSIVVGVGPGSRRGDIPYQSYRTSGPFEEGKDHAGLPALICPADGAVVWANTPSRRAYGPLTMQEMQGLAGRKWLVPGTENPFPPEPAAFNPNDPFSGGQAHRRRPVKPK